MSIESLALYALSLALAAAISRIAVDVRKIRKHFDRTDHWIPVIADAPVTAKEPEPLEPARRPAFVPPPIRTPDPAR